MEDDKVEYKLYYWTGDFSGRGEYVRMMLDVCGVKWEDTIRKTGVEGDGRPVDAIDNPTLFAPHLVEVESKLVINQWASCI